MDHTISDCSTWKCYRKHTNKNITFTNTLSLLFLSDWTMLENIAAGISMANIHTHRPIECHRRLETTACLSAFKFIKPVCVWHWWMKPPKREKRLMHRSTLQTLPACKITHPCTKYLTCSLTNTKHYRYFTHVVKQWYLWSDFFSL